jgi:hypothetical protein
MMKNKQVKDWKELCDIFEDRFISPKRIINVKKKKNKLVSLTFEVDDFGPGRKDD